MSNLANIIPTLPLDCMNAVLEGPANLGASPSRRLALKHVLDLLKRLAGRFGIAEKHMNDNDSAERAKYHIRLPGYVRKCRGDEHGQGKVEDPVPSSGDPDTLGSICNGKNFRGVDPSHRSLFTCG